MSLQKEVRYEAERLRRTAKGAPCCIRIGDVCNDDPYTSVPCHRPTGSGEAYKSDDLEMAIGCSECHDFIDARSDAGKRASKTERLYWFYRGVEQTHRYWLSIGILQFMVRIGSR